MSQEERKRKVTSFRIDPGIIDQLRKIADEDPRVNLTLLVESALEHIISSSKEERNRIIAKYFDPTWLGKDKDDE